MHKLSTVTTQRQTNGGRGGLTFAQRLLQQVVLGLEFDDEVAAVQILLEFLNRGRGG